MAILIVLVFFMEILLISYGKKIYYERQKITEINKRISILSLKMDKDRSRILFNKHFLKVNFVNYLKNFFEILPKTIRVKKINIIKLKTGYIFSATVFDIGGYRRFSLDYNTIAKKLNYKKELNVKYLFNKSGKPSMKFYGFLK